MCYSKEIAESLSQNVKNIYRFIHSPTEVISAAKKRATKMNTCDFLWQLLTSSRFSVYSHKMQKQFITKNTQYIQMCVETGSPIHIVLAGMPGKCANVSKVSHRTPDLGELATFIQFALLNTLVKLKHAPGIKVSFFSDYVGLQRSFFPECFEIEKYISILRRWIAQLDLPIEIFYVDDMFPEAEELIQAEPINLTSSIVFFKEYLSRHVYSEQLFSSMKDNMNITRAQEYYYNRFHIVPLESDIVKASIVNYNLFWKYWSEYKVVENFFGSVIYASPVSYHPEKRLCLRLQDSAARVAPWNGCGVIVNGKIISCDERCCKNDKYISIVDHTGYMWGYLESAIEDTKI